MQNPDTVRETVSRAYARAVSEPVESKVASCCGSAGDGCGSGAPASSTSSAQKGVAVRTAGYSSEDVEALPADAVVNAFGCGNPLAFSNVRPGEVVLDLGSGAGIDLLIASRKVGPGGRVIGVDMTDAMIERARANIEEAGATNVEVRKGLIEALPVESGSVDRVISNCVINLSPEKDRVFAEIARVLKPGGRISISDIVVDHLPEAIRAIPAVYNSCVGGAISEDAYVAGLERAGLVEVDVTERFVYSVAHIEAIVASEFDGSGGPPPSIGDGVAGRVWSARFSGRKAADEGV